METFRCYLCSSPVHLSSPKELLARATNFCVVGGVGQSRREFDQHRIGFNLTQRCFDQNGGGGARYRGPRLTKLVRCKANLGGFDPNEGLTPSKLDSRRPGWGLLGPTSGRNDQSCAGVDRRCSGFDQALVSTQVAAGSTKSRSALTHFGLVLTSCAAGSTKPRSASTISGWFRPPAGDQIGAGLAKFGRGRQVLGPS